MNPSSRASFRCRYLTASFSACLLLALQQAGAATLSWDADALYNNGTLGGDGTWNTTTTNWDNGSNDVAFVSATDSATFGGTLGTLGTVTLGTSLTAVGVTLSTTGYQFTGTSGTKLTIGTGGFNAGGLAATFSTIDILTDTATWNNTDQITFNSSVAFVGSRTLTLNNTSGNATTFSNLGVASGSSSSAAKNASLAGSAPIIINSLSAGLNNQTFTLTSGTAASTLTYTGSNTLTINGNNTKFLSTNASSGTGITLAFVLNNSLGTLALGNDNALGAVDGSNNATGTLLVLQAGKLQASSARAIANNTILLGNATIGGSQDINITGSFTNSGANSASWQNATTNLYTSSTSAISRTLTVNNSAATTLSGPVYLSEAQTAGGNYARSLTIGGTGNLLISGAIANYNPLSLAGVANTSTGANALTKSGTGTLTLSGNNTYTGLTTVSAGKLLINGTNTGGSYSIASGATFGGTGTIDLSATNGSVTIGNGSFLEASSADALTFTLGTGALNVSGALANASPSMFFTLGTPGVTVISSSSTNIGSGVLEFADLSFTAGSGFGAGTYTLFTSIVGTMGVNLTGTVGGLDATISQSGNDIILTTVSAVPEPSTYAAMAGVGVLGVALLRRRRRN